MKIGISIKLDVKKLDKARFFAANSGALYVDLTMFLDTENEGQYGDHGFATQSASKEERDGGLQLPIVGNGKIFYGLNDLKNVGQAPQQGQAAPQQTGGFKQQQAAPQQQGGFAQQTQPQQQTGFNGAPQQTQQQYIQNNGQAPQGQQAPKVNPQEPTIDFDDDIPF